MANDIKLSIVIPVYNVELYLRKCVDSIISQNCDQCEIVLVDDGSTDKSGEICDSYRNTKGITVYHKNNGGLSDTRNYGIRHSSGEYLLFVDSDDYLEPNALKNILDALCEYHPDVLTAKSKMVFDDGKIVDEVDYSIKEGLYEKTKFFKILKRHSKSIIFCAQYFICRREIVIYNNLLFKEGVIHEDELWTPQLLLVSRNIYYLDAYFYFHLMRGGSIMHSNNDIKSGKSLLVIAPMLNEKYKNVHNDIWYLRDRMANFYLQAYPKLGKEYLREFDRKIPLKNAYYFKTFLKALIFYISPNLYLKLWKNKYK